MTSGWVSYLFGRGVFISDKQYIAPTAHYEMAVLLWQEHGPGEHNEEIKQWLTKASAWGSYELDTRVGMKIQTALDTINTASSHDQA